MPFEVVFFFPQYFIFQYSVVLVVLIQAVFLWEADKGYTNMLSLPEKNLQLSHRKCPHEARVGWGPQRIRRETSLARAQSFTPIQTRYYREKAKRLCVPWLCCV